MERLERLQAKYRVRAAAAEIDAIARALALEQSVEVPLEAVRDAFVREEIVGRVESIEPAGAGAFDVRIALALETTGLDVAQTINMLFGNSSLHAHVELVDAIFPRALIERFGGPRFGIAGLRERTGVYGRPLTCTALKPQGIAPDALAALAFEFATNGIDVIKDDHGLADQRYSPFAARVRACQRAVERANRASGKRVLYAPSLVGAPGALAAQARIAREEGVGMVLLAPALIGMPVFAELVPALGVPVLAHPAYAGAARVAPEFLLGRLFRLLGADAVIYPNHGGRFGYSRTQCEAIADAARAPWSDVRATFPVPAGGMSVERVPEMIDCYGKDAMLLIGGALLMAGDALPERTRQFAAAVQPGVVS